MQIRAMFVCSIALTLFTAGCRGQAGVSPQPTATVTWPAIACPASTTCGYIVSRATCPTSTTCPAPASNGPYVPIQTAAAPLTTNSYTDSAPPAGVWEAYSIQFVETVAGQSPVTGNPSPASSPTLIATFPATPAQPNVTTTAQLAPPLSPITADEKIVASDAVPTAAQPHVAIHAGQ